MSETLQCQRCGGEAEAIRISTQLGVRTRKACSACGGVDLLSENDWTICELELKREAARHYEHFLKTGNNSAYDRYLDRIQRLYEVDREREAVSRKGRNNQPSRQVSNDTWQARVIPQVKNRVAG